MGLLSDAFGFMYSGELRFGQRATLSRLELLQNMKGALARLGMWFRLEIVRDFRTYESV